MKLTTGKQYKEKTQQSQELVVSEISKTDRLLDKITHRKGQEDQCHI